MMPTAQRRAIEKYRRGLATRGFARFEVIGLASDRELIRSLARQLAEETPEAEDLRSKLEGAPPGRGGILAALRRSPLADLDVRRDRHPGRKVAV